jgi:uncharacterized membrane protein HdeD (DUF308 family)
MNSSVNHKRWSITFGIILMILGLATLSAQVFTTIISVFFLGWMLIWGGIAEFFYGFFSGSVGRALLYFLGGIVTVVVGEALAFYPEISAANITVIIGLYMVIVGIYKVFASIINRYSGWGWNFVSGIVMFLLGEMIFNHWPMSGLWVIGLFIGVEFLITGFGLTVNAFRSTEYEAPNYQGAGYVSGEKGGRVKK